MRLVAVPVLLSAVGACGIASASMSWRMIEEVNSNLPESQRFDLLGWTVPKYRRLSREYKRLYPAGRLASQFWYFAAAMLALLIGVAWLIGSFE